MNNNLKKSIAFLFKIFASVLFCEILSFLGGRKNRSKKGLMFVEFCRMEGRKKGSKTKVWSQLSDEGSTRKQDFELMVN